MGAEQAGEWDTATPLIWKQSEGSSWRTRVPPPLPAAPVTAHRFLQQDLVRRDERAWAPFPGPAALCGVLPGTLSSPASKPLLPDIPCCVTQDLRPDQGAPPPQLGWVLNSVPNPSGQRGPTWSQQS